MNSQLRCFPEERNQFIMRIFNRLDSIKDVKFEKVIKVPSIKFELKKYGLK